MVLYTSDRCNNGLATRHFRLLGWVEWDTCFGTVLVVLSVALLVLLVDVMEVLVVGSDFALRFGGMVLNEERGKKEDEIPASGEMKKSRIGSGV